MIDWIKNWFRELFIVDTIKRTHRLSKEEIEHIQNLHDFDYTPQEIAVMVRRSITTVRRYIKMKENDEEA